MAITLGNQNELNQLDGNFVNNIIDKITLFGSIPYTIPTKMVIEVIKSSARYFYKYHANSWKQSYYIIKRDDIIKYAGTDNFYYLGLTINPEIRIISEIYESNVSDYGGISAAIFQGQNYGNDMYNSSVNNNLYLIESTVKLVEARAMRNMLSSRMPYDFSPNTHELSLKRAPSADLVLDVLRDNPINSLYNDAWFERHVIANTKKELKRLIAGHTFMLPGGVTLSADEICNNLEDAENVENLIKSSSGVGDIIMKRN